MRRKDLQQQRLRSASGISEERKGEEIISNKKMAWKQQQQKS